MMRPADTRADHAATQALRDESAGRHRIMTTDDPKTMAKRLRSALADRGIELGHSETLELVARQYGARDWNTFAARSGDGLGPVIPILRIFDVAKAREFYTGYLGFTIDWEHTFDDHTPVYLQASRDDVVLHLSEHHGDASPGAAVRILVTDVRRLHKEFAARDYQYAKPGIETQPWGLEVAVLDPFANRLVFHQPTQDQPTEGGGTVAGPIEHEYVVAVPPERAFELFTAEITHWWHKDYAPPGLTGVTIEPRVGGACTLRIDDGSAYPWGTVTTWDPPGHYAQDFTLAQDADHPSRIDVRFDPAPGGTRVRFSHGGWTAGNVAGRARFSEWPFLLGRYLAYAEGRPLPER